MFFHLSLAHGIYLSVLVFPLSNFTTKKKENCEQSARNLIPCECIQPIDHLKFAEFENSFQLPFYETIQQICWFCFVAVFGVSKIHHILNKVHLMRTTIAIIGIAICVPK